MHGRAAPHAGLTVSLQRIKTQRQPPASHKQSVAEAALSYSSAAAGLQLTLWPGPWALLG